MPRPKASEMLNQKQAAKYRAIFAFFSPNYARLTAGAHNTFLSGQPLPRESGFFISTCANKPGSVLAIQDPYGESGRPDSRQVVKYPALARPHKTPKSLSQNFLSLLEDAMKRLHITPPTPKTQLKGGVA